MDEEIEKIYWSLEDCAKEFNVAVSNIRWWVTEFKLPNKRVGKNHKILIHKEEMTTLRKIYQLLRVEHYRIEGAKLQLHARNAH